MLTSLLGWFDRIPIADPVDRRNARVIQGVLLFLAVTLPAMLLFAFMVAHPTIARGRLPVPMLVSAGLSLTIAVLAALGVWMIRRGRFRPAVRAMLGMLLAMLSVNALGNGLQGQLQDQLAQMLLLILSGLVLGRRALWITFVALLAVVALGALRDMLVLFAQTPARAFYNVPPTLFSYFLVTILIDRTTQALRESLREAQARGEALKAEIGERERTHAQLIHAQKQDITERMASGMAHDYNNIFAVIAGFSAERHEDDGGSDAQRIAQLQASLAAVEAAARRGMALSRRQLRFARRDQTHAEVFDAGDAIEALRPMLRQLLDARIVLECTRAADALPILFDRSEFELMLLNLACNARDAIAGNGRFAIDVRALGSRVVIVLRDDGAGMPSSVRDRAFEPFFSTKPADGGTGLGLAVVHDLVTRADGTITIDSAPGRGTTVRIELPRAIEAS